MNRNSDEIENLAHTLIDLKTLHECNQYAIDRAMNLQNKISSRLEMLEGRMDRLTKESIDA